MTNEEVMLTAMLVARRLINEERERQDSRWGEQDHDPITWMSILTEEVGEAAHAANENKWNEQSLDDFKNEMVQVAAVAQAIIECLERASLRADDEGKQQ